MASRILNPLALRLYRPINADRLSGIISQISEFTADGHDHSPLESLFKSTVDMERNDLFTIINYARDRSPREYWYLYYRVSDYIRRRQCIGIIRNIQRIHSWEQRSGFRSLDKVVLKAPLETSSIPTKFPLSFECTKECWKRFKRRACQDRKFKKRICKDNKGHYYYIVLQRRPLPEPTTPLFIRLFFTWRNDKEDFSALQKGLDVVKKAAVTAKRSISNFSIDGATESKSEGSARGGNRMAEAANEERGG